MSSFEEQPSLVSAEGFLTDLDADRRSAPSEIQPLIESYAARLTESVRRFRDRAISVRELDAHAFQIRLSYAQDLKKLLAVEEPAPVESTETLEWFPVDDDPI